MKKIIFFLLFIPSLVFGQYGKIISNKSGGGSLHGDTLKSGSLILKQTTSNQTITLGNYTSGTTSVIIKNEGSVSVILSPGSSLSVHGMASYSWSGSSWSVLIGSSGSIPFASLTGQPTDNANLATALNGKVNVSGDTMTGNLSFSPGYKGIVFPSGDIIKDSTNFLNIKSGGSGKISVDANSSLTLKSENNSVKINADQNLNILTGNILASTVPYIDASNNLISSAITPIELGYSSGLNDSIQKQLNAKQAGSTNLNHWSSIDTSAKANIPYVDAKVSDAIYGSGWNGVTGIAPSKNAVYDKIELLTSQKSDTGVGLIKTSNLLDVPNKSTARTNLGLAIGVNIQAFSSNLSKWSLLDSNFATAFVNGRLSFTDWNLFNNKQNALGFTPYNSTNPSGYISSVVGPMTGNVTPNSNASYKLGSGFFALNFLYTRNIYADTSATGTDVAGNNINYATGVGTGASATSKHRFRSTQSVATGTARQTLGDAAAIGFVTTSATDAGIWFNIASGSETANNLAVGSSGTVTHVNGSSGVQLRNNNTTVWAISSNAITSSQTNIFATGTTTLAPFRIPTSSVFKTTPVSGDFDRDANRIRFTNDGLQPQEIILSQQSRVSTQFDKTNTTLADVTGLTATVVASGIYKFKAALFVDATLGGGSKFAIGGTATATDIKYQIILTDNTTIAASIASRQTAIGGSAGQAGTTSGWCIIEGTIVVNTAGTLTVQFAQNTANGTSSILTGSTFLTQQTN